MKHIFRKKITWLFTLAVAALMVVPFAAFADDISNNLDVSVDADYETLALTAGGSAGYATLRVIEQNGDGKNGCNLTGSTILKIAVSSSDSSKAAASLVQATTDTAKDTFTSCSDTIRVRVTPLAAGSTDITVSQVANTTAGTFNLLPARFTVTVSTLNTAPTVSVTGVVHGATYEIGSVPTPGCSVVDAEDTNEAATPVVSSISGPNASYGIGTQKVTCSYTDGGGITETDEATYEIVDTHGPTITFVSRTAANGNGWNNGNVTVNWSCSDSGSGVVSATVSQTLSAEGANQTATGTCTDVAGNSASDSQTGINIDKTAPTASASASPVANANGWNNSDVTVSFSGSDGLSGIATCSPDVVLSAEGAGQSASGTCTDKAGNVSAPATASGINIDKTAPTASASASPGPNGNGWNNTDVTVSYNCTDGGSGVDIAASSLLDDLLTASGSATGTCFDLAGNSDSANYAAQIDKVAPVVTASASPGPNAYGWNNRDVTVSFSGSDGLSGVANCDTAVVLSAEGAGQSASGTCTDKAGNVSALATASGINIDKTAPSVSLVGGPADDASYYFGFVPAAPTCNASDALSGVDGSCSVSGYGTSLGSHTVTASVTDKAGNTASASASYTVLAWTLKGFYQPVDMSTSGLVYNTVKNGSTVPFKFEVFAGATELTDVNAVKGFTATQVTCAAAPEDVVEETVTATGGTVLRYDATSGQFVYNWKTPSKAGNCYRVIMTTQDNSTLSAYFKLK